MDLLLLAQPLYRCGPGGLSFLILLCVFFFFFLTRCRKSQQLAGGGGPGDGEARFTLRLLRVRFQERPLRTRALVRGWG